MIKPEDIPDRLVENWLADGVSNSWKDFIARRLNDAIEQGVISPPCWEVVMKQGTPFAFKKKKAAEAWALSSEDCEVRHWKGQTE